MFEVPNSAFIYKIITSDQLNMKANKNLPKPGTNLSPFIATAKAIAVPNVKNKQANIARTA